MENSRLIMQPQYKTEAVTQSHVRHPEDEEPAGDSKAGRSDFPTTAEHSTGARPFIFTHLFGQRISEAVSCGQQHHQSHMQQTEVL